MIMSRAYRLTSIQKLFIKQRLSAVSTVQDVAAASLERPSGVWTKSILSDSCAVQSTIVPRQLFHTGRKQNAGLDELLESDPVTTRFKKDSPWLNARSSKVFSYPKRQKKTPKRVVEVYRGITVAELCEILEADLDQIWDTVIANKDLAEHIENEDQKINDVKTIVKLCEILKVVPKIQSRDRMMQSDGPEVDVSRRPPPSPKELVPRPPVITIMGHIDHGKTTLLDALRKSNVVSQEFGGITQHIGAFSVKTSSGNDITFLDTPGHAAFTALRERGAIVTDIIVLVVSADDGVMPQTIESIEHAQKYGVPLVIAINKIDRPNANIERTLNSLLEHGIQTELNGGDIPAVPISALMGENISELQDTIAALAEILDLKCDVKGEMEGRIIESKMDSAIGLVATVLVQKGTMKIGSMVVAGEAYGKIKKMVNNQGQAVRTVTPAFCAEVSGWRELPQAGDKVIEVKTMKKAQELISTLAAKRKAEEIEKNIPVIERKQEEQKEIRKKLMELKSESFRKFRLARKQITKYGDLPSTLGECHLPIVLKADVYGSIEALLKMFSKFDSQLCELRVVHHEVGPVTEADVNLAESLKAEIFSFNVPVSEDLKRKAEQADVVIRENNVIYKLIDELNESANSRVPPVMEEDKMGEAEVLQVFEYKFKDTKRMVAGCRCTQGNLLRKLEYKVLRDGEEIYKGKLDSLKHHKDEVDTISMGKECGILVSDENFTFEQGDVIECFDWKVVKKTVDWTPG